MTKLFVWHQKDLNKLNSTIFHYKIYNGTAKRISNKIVLTDLDTDAKYELDFSNEIAATNIFSEIITENEGKVYEYD